MTTSNEIKEMPAFKAEDFADPKEVKKSIDKRGKTTHSILLNTGQVAEIRTGTGLDAKRAQMQSGKDENYIPALMSAVVFFDGERKVMEDFDQLDMRDYNRIQMEFMALNF